MTLSEGNVEFQRDQNGIRWTSASDSLGYKNNLVTAPASKNQEVQMPSKFSNEGFSKFDLPTALIQFWKGS